MNLSEKRRIAIIGMGYAGLAVCWNLLLLGKVEVTLFDRCLEGAGASSVSAGLLHSYPGADARLSKEGHEGLNATLELIKEANRFNARPVATKTGLMRFAMDEEQRQSFIERAKQHADLQFFTEEEVSKQFPELPQRAALWIKEAYVIQTSQYLAGLRKACFAAGASYMQQEVQEANTWHGLNISEEFDAVVMAMGADSLQFKLFQDLPLRPIKGQVMKLSLPEHCPLLAYPITGDCYLIPDSVQKCYVAGATFEKQFTSKESDPTVAKTLLCPRFEAILPQLKEAHVLEVRAGVRLTTLQHQPIAKQIAPRLWVLTALGSKGLLYHALLAKRIAEEIYAGKEK